jgi:hypothetical protein
MSAPVARHLSSELQLIAESHAAERELVAGIAESLLAIAPMVDRGGRTGPQCGANERTLGAGPGLHYALYCEVPAGTRGATFGARARELVAAHGVSARIGIADDKFTAWAAASQIRSSGTRMDDVAAVVSVPRGGAAAFLAPLPLSMLPISPEVQHMLGALGVKTLGEFAALPEPTTGSAAGSGGGTFGGAASDDGFGMDLQALARGDSREAARLIPYRGRAVTSESITITPDHSAAAAIGTLAERLALVLKGRGEAAAQIRFKVRKADDSVRSVELILVPTVVDAAVLADRLGACLGDASGAVGLSIEVVGVSLHGPVAEPVPMAAPQEPAEIMDSLEHGFQLALPASELGYNAPDGHRYRRMRRGKQRRRSEVTAQSRLFGA